jgi:hypothetical protein
VVPKSVTPHILEASLSQGKTGQYVGLRILRVWGPGGHHAGRHWTAWTSSSSYPYHIGMSFTSSSVAMDATASVCGTESSSAHHQRLPTSSDGGKKPRPTYHVHGGLRPERQSQVGHRRRAGGGRGIDRLGRVPICQLLPKSLQVRHRIGRRHDPIAACSLLPPPPIASHASLRYPARDRSPVPSEPSDANAPQALMHTFGTSPKARVTRGLARPVRVNAPPARAPSACVGRAAR